MPGLVPKASGSEDRASQRDTLTQPARLMRREEECDLLLFFPPLPLFLSLLLSLLPGLSPLLRQLGLVLLRADVPCRLLHG